MNRYKVTFSDDTIMRLYNLWREHLWNPSYFVATVSENTEEQIRRYIQNQKRK